MPPPFDSLPYPIIIPTPSLDVLLTFIDVLSQKLIVKLVFPNGPVFEH